MRAALSPFAGLLLAVFLCRAASAAEPAPALKCKDCSLLMISLTNIGAGHMSLYGYGRKTTPGLDKWAGGALVFEDAFTPASWTLPVATSLFTSLYPYTHRVLERDRNNTLGRGIKTLPEILSAAGYRTGAFTGGLDYMKAAGHMRGFGTAPGNPPFTGFGVTTAQAADWLSKNSGGRFFLFLHGYDAHPPFIPSKRSGGVFSGAEGGKATVDPSFTYRGYREPGAGSMTVHYHLPGAGPAAGSEGTEKGVPRGKAVLSPADINYLRDLYDEKVLDADRAAVDFLASLDKALLDRTVVVIFSEHGEMFAEHGRFGRGGAYRGTLYDEVAHVPLIIRVPGAGAGRVRGLVQLIDIMPTLAEILGVPVPGRVQGKSLLPLVTSGTAVNEFAYAGTTYDPYAPGTTAPYGLASLTESVRDKKWKLIHEIAVPGTKDRPAAKTPRETFELYDIEGDPGETLNAAAAHPDIVKALARELERWNASSREFLKTSPGTRRLPGAVLEKARQHGYW